MSLQADFHHALLGNEPGTPGGLRTCNGSDPAARFAVYRNNVLSSLINALADSYPVVQALVGVEFFRAMAQGYVHNHPPRSRLLVHYGDDLADFIADFEPARSLPYLADVARLEARRIQAYHAADVEPVSTEELAAAVSDAAQLPGLVFHLHPSLHVLSSAYAVRSLWAAHQGELTLEQIVIEQPEHCLVLRQGLDVLVIELDAASAGFIYRLRAGQPFAAATANCPADFDLSACLALLIHYGAITALSCE
jgi:hypothetical protein